jgi:hypothetical protein
MSAFLASSSFHSNVTILRKYIMDGVKEQEECKSKNLSELYPAFLLRLPTEVCGTHQGLLRNSSTKLPSIARLITERHIVSAFTEKGERLMKETLISSPFNIGPNDDDPAGGDCLMGIGPNDDDAPKPPPPPPDKKHRLY